MQNGAHNNGDSLALDRARLLGFARVVVGGQVFDLAVQSLPFEKDGDGTAGGFFSKDGQLGILVDDSVGASKAKAQNRAGNCRGGPPSLAACPQLTNPNHNNRDAMRPSRIGTIRAPRASLPRASEETGKLVSVGARTRGARRGSASLRSKRIMNPLDPTTHSPTEATETDAPAPSPEPQKPRRRAGSLPWTAPRSARSPARAARLPTRQAPLISSRATKHATQDARAEWPRTSGAAAVLVTPTFRRPRAPSRRRERPSDARSVLRLPTGMRAWAERDRERAEGGHPTGVRTRTPRPRSRFFHRPLPCLLPVGGGSASLLS